jgi:hypothetical protein
MNSPITIVILGPYNAAHCEVSDPREKHRSGLTKNDKVESCEDVRGFPAFPLGHRVVKVAAVIFILFNLGSWFGFVTSQPLYADWLERSRPITDRISVIVPAIASATTFLDKDRPSGSYRFMIPSVRNLLAVNFALFFLFPTCFALAACVDDRHAPDRMRAGIDAISRRVEESINELFWRSAVFPIVFIVLAYFGVVTHPWLISYTRTVEGYIIMFGVSELFAFQAICYLIALSSSSPSERGFQTSADKPTDI